MSRRDAAIAAALTGTVVVVLGYASGLGLEVQQSLAQPPSQPAAPIASEQSHTTEPMPTMPSQMVAMPAVPGDASDAGGPLDRPADHSHRARPPSPPIRAEPTPDVDEPAACSPGLLEDLPVVGTVTSLLGSLLGSVQVLSVPLPVVGDVGCLVGEVLGPN